MKDAPDHLLAKADVNIEISADAVPADISQNRFAAENAERFSVCVGFHIACILYAPSAVDHVGTIGLPCWELLGWHGADLADLFGVEVGRVCNLHLFWLF